MSESSTPIVRTALVTGGSRGIGRAICLELAKAGCNVAVNYAGSAAAAEETAAQCRALGVRAQVFQADVSSAAACAALLEQVLAAFGRIDVLVNNAGVTRDNLLLRMSEEDYDRVLDTNLKGAVFCCKAVARPMMRQRYGRIVNLSSVVGLRGNAGQVNYSASKAGLLARRRTLVDALFQQAVDARLHNARAHNATVFLGFAKPAQTSRLTCKVCLRVVVSLLEGLGHRTAPKLRRHKACCLEV